MTAPRPVLVALCALVPFAALLRAQQSTPGPELAKLAPMLGHWAGSGTMTQPSGPTKWTARSSFRWVLGGFWMQEDLSLTFAGNPDPLVFRSYLGWDRERRTFVNVTVNNGGEAQAHDFTMQPDGTLLQWALQHQHGATYAERSLLKVDGETMTQSVDLLPGNGPSLALVEGTLQREHAEAPSALDTKTTWMQSKPHASMQQLVRMAGSYETKGQIVFVPGQPAIQIRGVDTWRAIFGGTVLHLHGEGEAPGLPGKYECDAFWAWNSQKDCLVAFRVTNQGEFGAMEVRFADDGKALVGTMAMTIGGLPMVGRSVTALDDAGQPQSLVGHLLMGTSPPFENFRATFTKK